MTTATGNWRKRFTIRSPGGFSQQLALIPKSSLWPPVLRHHLPRLGYPFVEHTVERTKQDKLLIEFLTTDRGIAFNHMFAMKEYPRDILPLYSQGYSLSRYLIAKGGKRKFVQYLGDGMKWNNWTAATHKHYNLRSLSELQITWLDWVRNGSPAIPPDNRDSALALDTSPYRSPDAGDARATPSPTPPGGRLVPLPSREPSVDNNSTVTAASPSNGWYSRRRDEAMRNSAQPGQRRVGRPEHGEEVRG